MLARLHLVAFIAPVSNFECDVYCPTISNCCANDITGEGQATSGGVAGVAQVCLPTSSRLVMLGAKLIGTLKNPGTSLRTGRE